VDESVNFTIWGGSDIRLGRFFGNSESLDAIPADWDGAALHQTCVGKIILANMSNEDRKLYFRRISLPKNTGNMTVNINQIKKQISVVRRENLAFEEGERLPGVSGVAAGVRNSEGETIGAIFIIGPSNRLTPAVLERIAINILRGAVKISSELGFQA
jgi:IclR family acetate operon transcriptional repressor